jgi:hypothetical protein
MIGWLDSTSMSSETELFHAMIHHLPHRWPGCAPVRRRLSEALALHPQPRKLSWTSAPPRSAPGALRNRGLLAGDPPHFPPALQASTPCSRIVLGFKAQLPRRSGLFPITHEAPPQTDEVYVAAARPSGADNGAASVDRHLIPKDRTNRSQGTQCNAESSERRRANHA